MSEDLTCFLCHCETEHYTTSDSDLHMALVKTCRKSSDRQFLRSLYFNEKKKKNENKINLNLQRVFNNT